MPHKQKHRGPRSEDEELFNNKTQAVLKEAVYDYSFLLTRGYSEDALFKLVGDRYQLHKRQRLAVMRSACADQSLEHRRKSLRTLRNTSDPIFIDGFNLIITIESALSGGFIFEGRDHCFRDLASIHATYKKVEETWPALHLIGDYLNTFFNGKVIWYLDQPVSNSGRLKAYMEALAEEYEWPWEVILKPSPDYALKGINEPVVSTDSLILDRANQWLNLARWIITANHTKGQILSLKPDPDKTTQ